MCPFCVYATHIAYSMKGTSILVEHAYMIYIGLRTIRVYIFICGVVAYTIVCMPCRKINILYIYQTVRFSLKSAILSHMCAISDGTHTHAHARPLTTSENCVFGFRKIEFIMVVNGFVSRVILLPAKIFVVVTVARSFWAQIIIHSDYTMLVRYGNTHYAYINMVGTHIFQI